jgi:hypothetical protein
MKNKTILLCGSIAAYCSFFYDQYAGINVVLFTAVLIGVLLAMDKTLLYNRSWVLVASGAVITGISALLYGHALACIGNVISLLVLANLSIEKNASMFFAFLQSCFSFFAVPIVRLTNAINRYMSEEDEKIANKNALFSMGNFLKFFIPVVILLVFFFVYKASNPVFSAFVKNINFEISWSFIWFLMTGSYLVYIFFNQYAFEPLLHSDKTKLNQLQGINDKERSLFRTVDVEFGSAILTFSMLNLLLLLVNVLDLQFIFNNDKNVHEYSRYIHQGVNSSIFSVLIAILVTLYFFRGNLNYFTKSKQLRVVALIWIAQNIFLLATCVHKNYSYIYEFGLTQKRIGVYFYLLITFIGLALTWMKITRLKSNMFLVRANTWSVFGVLILSSLVNWNKLILKHNTTYKSSIEREYYLYEVPYTSLPFLLKNWENLPIDQVNDPGDKIFYSQLNQQKKRFLTKFKTQGWQSWNVEDQQIFDEIVQLNK